MHADMAKPGKKRQVRDAKFGFGGRKKLSKQNTAASAADMSGMRASKGGGKGGGKGAAKGKKGRLGAKGGVQKRPGKDARAAKRAQR